MGNSVSGREDTSTHLCTSGFSWCCIYPFFPCRRAERKEAMREKNAKVRSGEVKPSF